MKAMTTRYRPATTHRGSRMLASDGDNNRALVVYDSGRDDFSNHLSAVEALCSKMNWHGTLTGGHYISNGVMVWVWYRDERGICQGTTVNV